MGLHYNSRLLNLAHKYKARVDLNDSGKHSSLYDITALMVLKSVMVHALHVCVLMGVYKTSIQNQCFKTDRLVAQLCLHFWSGGTPVLLACPS